MTVTYFRWTVTASKSCKTLPNPPKFLFIISNYVLNFCLFIRDSTTSTRHSWGQRSQSPHVKCYMVYYSVVASRKELMNYISHFHLKWNPSQNSTSKLCFTYQKDTFCLNWPKTTSVYTVNVFMWNVQKHMPICKFNKSEIWFTSDNVCEIKAFTCKICENHMCQGNVNLFLDISQTRYNI